MRPLILALAVAVPQLRSVEAFRYVYSRFMSTLPLYCHYYGQSESLNLTIHPHIPMPILVQLLLKVNTQIQLPMASSNGPQG